MISSAYKGSNIRQAQLYIGARNLLELVHLGRREYTLDSVQLQLILLLFLRSSGSAFALLGCSRLDVWLVVFVILIGRLMDQLLDKRNGSEEGEDDSQPASWSR